jgi:uncharacterized membrane protein YqiK
VLAGVVAMSVMGAVLWRYRRVGPEAALVVEGKDGGKRVCLGGGLVWPGEKAEVLSLSARKVVVERRGRQGLSCRDGVRVDVRVTFLVKVEREPEAVRRVVGEVGCARANREEEVQGLFEQGFAGVLASAASTFTFEELVGDRGLFVEHVMMEAGNELLGFKLERVSLGKLEQTPLDRLDATDELDARGILTLTERAMSLPMAEDERERHWLWMEERERQEEELRNNAARRRDSEAGRQEDPRRREAELEWEVDRALAERARG